MHHFQPKAGSAYCILDVLAKKKKTASISMQPFNTAIKIGVINFFQIHITYFWQTSWRCCLKKSMLFFCCSMFQTVFWFGDQYKWEVYIS